MMDGTRPPSSDGGDRLSKLEDSVLGHVLSFLPANEAAGAALLSSRWRDVFDAVHITLDAGPPELPGTTNVVIEVVETASTVTGNAGVYSKPEVRCSPPGLICW